jgi:hypothetical protein
MGKYFDFTPIKLWGGSFPLGAALSDIADTIRQDKQEKAKQELEKARTDAYIAQTTAQAQSVKNAETRAQAAEALAGAQRQGKTVQDIATALGGRRYGEAGGLAASSQFEDPRHPGRFAGVTFTRESPGAAPVEPTAPEAPGPAPVAPEAPAFPAQDEQDYYKTMSPDAARAQAISRALGGATQPPAPGSAQELMGQVAGETAAGTAERAELARGRFAADQMTHDIDQKAFDDRMKGLPAAQEAYQTEKKAYDERAKYPNVTLGFPNGQRVTIDPAEAERRKKDQAGEMAASLLKAADREPDAATAIDMRRRASLIASQLLPADKGAISNTAMASMAQKARSDLEDKKIEGQKEVAKIRAKGKKGTGGAGGGNVLPGASDERVLKEVKDALEPITRKGGLAENLQHSEGALRAIRNDPTNPVNWVNAIDAAIRTNTGRAAILSQYKLYTGKAAGTDDTAEQLWAGFTGAGLSDAQKTNLMRSFEASNSEMRRTSKDAYDNIRAYETDERVLKSPAVRLGYRAQVRNAFSGMPGWGGKKGATDEAQGGGGGGGPTQLSDEDKALVKNAQDEIAKNGPNAKSARAYLNHLGVK